MNKLLPRLQAMLTPLLLSLSLTKPLFPLNQMEWGKFWPA